MKKVILLSMMCLMAFSMQAQRCAVLEFRAGTGVSTSQVEGLSDIFLTYFRPAGYTMVERTQIDRVIDEQRFQRSNMTESQMVRVGKILNVSKIVAGTVNIVMGQYNVDVRVINVESGTIAARDGSTFSTSSYRASMQSLAQKLAGQIAIKSGGTVQSSSSNTSRKRSGVEVVYGYLKVFPNELGEFQSEPTSVIAQINKQAQHGYNNWRLPSNEELALLRANNYLGNGNYMTKENKSGFVLLVTDGKDYASIKAEENQRKEQERKKNAERERRVAQYVAQGWVDLGLPSRTLWKKTNEPGWFSKYGSTVVDKYENNVPTVEQFKELNEQCRWVWTDGGFNVIGPNGNSIFLPAVGEFDPNENFMNKNILGRYLARNKRGKIDSSQAFEIFEINNITGRHSFSMCATSRKNFALRLVQNP